MNWLRTNFPVLFSPTFWGLTLAALFAIADLYAWFRPELAEILRNWLIGVTGVNIVWKGATKLAGQ